MSSGDTESVLYERLAATSARFASGAATSELLLDVLDATMVAAGADMGNLQLVDTSSGALHIAAQRGFEGDFLDFFAIVLLDGSACAVALRDRRHVMISDVRTHPVYDLASRDAMLRACARAVVSLPLLSTAGGVIGVVSTHFMNPTEVSARSLALMSTCAQRAAAFIELRTLQAPPTPTPGTLIRLRVDAGLLPTPRDGQIWAGRSAGERCSGCDREILPGDIDYEVAENDLTLHFHVGCFNVWHTRAPRRDGTN